ncbi:type ISP restriction/modification enzyme [Borrelia persica]|uniref:type ISP restriction/modification enzyme n=1 Tax=Borrelia persica TaxID=44448 RepID=UPI0004660875|nr:type ISP restriction/modification enzyme [Borrelia persica]
MCNSKNIIAFKKYLFDLKETSKDEKTEHTDRTKLENLLNTLKPNSNIIIQHEPKRNKEGFGSPDYLIKTNESIVGYIEVKKIDQNLDDILKSTQIQKYKELSNNIILTNYIEFIWIRNKEITLKEILISREDLKKLNPELENEKVNSVTKIINEFFFTTPEKIKNTEELTSLLAYRTRTLKEMIELNLKSILKDDKQDKNNKEKLEFKESNALTVAYDVLIETIYGYNLLISEFADSIAQVITYGLFIARLNNKENIKINFNNVREFIPDNFSLIQNILDLIKDIGKNKKYFNLKWILDEIISIVNNIDTEFIFNRFSFTSTNTSSKDPYLYFYEDFLAKYDPSLRKSKGVYYTPHSVVSFITRSLNEVLKRKFGLNKGFAVRDKVTVLDFAVGTGTFLLEVIKTILKEIPKGSGKQEDYIKLHILKNLYGFEYLMAPYVISHLKLSEYLKEICNIDFNSKNTKLQIFLTNTLDKKIITDQKYLNPFFETLFSPISKENKLANEVKEKSILVILGNPPYSVVSKNKSDYISKLMEEYKQINGKSIKEKSMASLNDDYVKFIRFSEDRFENNEEGVIGIITNNGYLDNVTFRGMRYHLLKTFDEIYIINLHGSSRKKEKTNTGETDENVFDIQTGVAISIFIKYKDVSKKNALANVYYNSIKGKREEKYEFLDKNTIFSSDIEKLEYKPPYYFFIKKNFKTENIYSKGKSLVDIFTIKSTGVETQKDRIAIDYTEEKLLDKLKNLVKLSKQDARSKYGTEKDSTEWNLEKVQEFLKSTNISSDYVKKISYKPFDNRYVYYSKSKGIIGRPKYQTMKHILEIKDNIGLVITRLLSTDSFCHAFISSILVNRDCICSKSYVFPLYIKEDRGMFEDIKKENFEYQFRNFINNKYSKEFKAEKILGYIYAVLYSNIYRTKFYEHLKIDYPKIIFVDDIKVFETLSNLGSDLIKVHLLKVIPNLDSNIGKHIVDEDKNQNKIIEKVFYKKDKNELYYNKTSRFINVSLEEYEYMIGSYQVLKSYLKYRKGRKLELDEVEYIEKVIKILHYTIKKQKEVDDIISNLKEFNE